MQPTISSQNRSAAKETEIRFRKCEFCETDVKSDELPLHRETCVQRYKCLDCDSYISLPRINEHKAVCSHIRSQNRQRSTGESVHREERPVGSRAIQSDSQPQSRPAASRALEESKSPVNPPEPMVAPHRSPPASSNCHICNRSVNAAGTVSSEIQDHMVGHRLQQESIVRQKDERRRKIAEMRSFQQSLMNHGIARHANDDAYFSPENYEVMYTQELLKLDGDYYAPGKGLKVERLSLLQSFRHKGDEIECVICKETILVDAIVKMLPCMHVFHAECIDQWVIRVPKCPVDNREIELDIA